MSNGRCFNFRKLVLESEKKRGKKNGQPSLSALAAQYREYGARSLPLRLGPNLLDQVLELVAERAVAEVVAEPGDLDTQDLQPQISHSSGVQAPNQDPTIQQVWAPSRTQHTAGVGWHIAERCVRDGPKMVVEVTVHPVR